MIETRNACLDRNFIRITRAMTTDVVAMAARREALSPRRNSSVRADTRTLLAAFAVALLLEMTTAGFDRCLPATVPT